MSVYPHITVTLDIRPDAPNFTTQARVAMARAGVPERQLRKFDRRIRKISNPARIVDVVLDWVGDVVC